MFCKAATQRKTQDNVSQLVWKCLRIPSEGLEELVMGKFSLSILAYTAATSIWSQMRGREWMDVSTKLQFFKCANCYFAKISRFFLIQLSAEIFFDKVIFFHFQMWHNPNSIVIFVRRVCYYKQIMYQTQLFFYFAQCL